MQYVLNCQSCGAVSQVPINSECPTCPVCGKYIKGDEKLLAILNNPHVQKMARNYKAFKSVTWEPEEFKFYLN